LQDFALDLERGLIDDQARGDRHDVLDRDQLVGLQRAAGGHQVDDGVGQPGQRRQFHRAVELDQVDMHALGGEVLARRLDVLGGDLEAVALAHGGGVVETFRHGDHHPALGDLQVERLVEAFAAMLDQHVLAGDAEVGGAVLHVGRHIGGADDDHAHIGGWCSMISLREVSGFSAGTMPAAASSGRVSSKMRPLERAMVMSRVLKQREPGFFASTNAGLIQPDGCSQPACPSGR
jgi:hypothetical protein